MNKLKYILIVAIIGLLAVNSCSEDFLEEKKTWTRNDQWLDTPEGLRAMAAGLPQIFRLMHGGEYSYCILNYGTDEFQLGNDPSNSMWNDYGNGLNSVVTGGSTNRVNPEVMWNICYVAINTQNVVIEKAPKVLDGQADLNTILGEAHFARGWSYFYLVQNWGGVPIKLAPSTSLEREFTRASREETIEQVISDFQIAYNNLSNPATIVPGKIYKDAAAHFLAKALLWRQSEICSDFNTSTKANDLTEALKLCDEVIDNRELAPNYADLWDFKTWDGPNERLPEVLLAAQYTDNSSGANGRANYMSQNTLYFLSIYRNWTGIERDVAGGREYGRMKNTEYAHDVYDRVNDSRFWKSFRTTQAINLLTQMKEPWATLGYKFKLGQLGLAYIVNEAGDTRFQVASDAVMPTETAVLPLVLMFNPVSSAHEDTIRCPDTNLPVPNVLPRYRIKAGSSTPEFAYPNYIWPSLCKYIDGLRSRTDISQQNASRDGIVARVGETYLMAAEIKIRQGEYPGALIYINKLRDRAAYKQGEDREKYVDGGQNFADIRTAGPLSSFYGKNTYYLSTGIAVTTTPTDLSITDWNNLPAEDEAIIAELGVSGEFNRALCFILNERSRELMGEMLRWADLARTKTLVSRSTKYNKEAFPQEYHIVRPIPQSFLDDIWKNGRPLTPAEKNEMQNQGY